MIVHHKILGNEDIVGNTPTLHKSRLLRAYNLRDALFNPRSNNLRDALIYGITKGNWPIIMH